MSLPGCREACTRPHLDLRACVPPGSDPVEEVSFLKVEKAGRLRTDRRGVGQCSCEVGDDEDRRTTHSRRGEEAVPVHA